MLAGCPLLSAQMHVKKHNPKMLIEALQLYSTLLHKQGIVKDFLDKPIKQGAELIEWLEKDYRNLNWFKMFMNALFLAWVENTSNKKVSETKLYKKYILFVQNSYLNLICVNRNEIEENIDIQSAIFRGMESYPFPDLKHKEECFDVDRVINNYREFYKWKLINQNIKADFYNEKYNWVN